MKENIFFLYSTLFVNSEIVAKVQSGTHYKLHCIVFFFVCFVISSNKKGRGHIVKVMRNAGKVFFK